MIYARTADKLDLIVKRIVIAIFVPAAMYLSPFIKVTFDWCLGRYTIDSWFFYYPIWYHNVRLIKFVTRFITKICQTVGLHSNWIQHHDVLLSLCSKRFWPHAL